MKELWDKKHKENKMLKELKPSLVKEINKIKRNLENFCENYKFKNKRKKL